MGWVLLTLCIVATATTSKGFLLPTNIAPLHYDLTYVFEIDPAANFSFYGVVNILLSVNTPTSKIVLHAKQFEIDEENVEVTDEKGAEYKVRTVLLNETYDLLTISVDKTLEKDNDYTLTIPFSGNLKISLDGVYISSYNDQTSKQKEYLIATQFEAISARKGFPCFDEPMYKATFSLTIGHHRDYTAVSNMPLINTTNENMLTPYFNWKEISKTFKTKDQSLYVFDEFDKSVPMSTYLVAFVVSKFKYQESPRDLSKAVFRIWARQDAIDQTTYASIIGPKILTHYEKWFNVPFPLPKQDMVAIPDFSAGAMENWGLITYRETALLFDDKQSSVTSKERIVSVVAHELAHQWFGNLVTMKWWSDLWLNEGFATFVQSLGMTAVEPKFRSQDVQAVNNILTVFAADALESSHPVSVALDDPKRISEIFDAISYKKGSALIRCMTMFLGMDVFRKAINQYLEKYSYRNAEQDDLWAELTAVNQQYGGLTRNVTIKQIMDTWTTQSGYPVLTVIRNYEGKTLTIKQHRFLALGSHAKTTSSWWVPLKVLSQQEVGKDVGPVQWLSNEDGTEDEFEFNHDTAPDEWILFNVDMIAPCRVNYDTQNWELLIQALTKGDFAAIPELSRVQLLTDAFAMASISVLPYSTALKLVNYLQRETEYLPLDTGLQSLDRISSILRRSPQYGVFQRFARKLIQQRYKSFGGLAKTDYRTDDLISIKMKVLTNVYACKMELPGCEEAAIEMFSQWMNSPNPDVENPIPTVIRKDVYCVAIRRGGTAHWQFLLERQKRANVATVNDQLLTALTCSRDVWTLKRLLDMSLSDNTSIRRQNSAFVIMGIIQSPVGYYVARDFIYNDIERIQQAFKSQGTRIGNIMKVLLDQFTTQKELDEFLVWQQKNAKYLEAAKLTISQGVESAKVNVQWATRHVDSVVKELEAISE